VVSGYDLWAARRRADTGTCSRGGYNAEMIGTSPTTGPSSARYTTSTPYGQSRVAAPGGSTRGQHPGYQDRRKCRPWVAQDGDAGRTLARATTRGMEKTNERAAYLLTESSEARGDLAALKRRRSSRGS